MAYQAINKEIFNNEEPVWPVKNPLRIVLLNGLAILLLMLMGCAPVADPPVQSGRLCENNDNPVATISPCEGPTGTVITVTPGRQLSSALGMLVFKRTLASGIPAQVISPISGDTVTTQPTHCMGGNGRWEVWLVLDDGQSQGKIGAFWTSGCVGGGSTGLGTPPGEDTTDTDPPKELIILPPVTINIDNEVYAKTRNTSQSYLKNIASSQPEVATGTEWGTNEVKIHGKKPGVTIITFLDDNTGTFYQVEVTVKDPTQGGDGAVEGAGNFIKTQKPVYLTDEQILVEYFGLPGNKQDWITIVKADAPENQFAEWVYTEGKQAGTHLFKGLPPGSYEARLYFNWPEGKYQVKSRYRFKVKENRDDRGCLVGKWEAVSVIDLNEKYTGGTGFYVTFKADGTQSIDYSAMKLLVFETEKFDYKGTATAHISTENNVAKIESIDSVKVIGTMTTISLPQPVNFKVFGIGPGGLGTTAGDNGYVCTQETLEYKTSVSKDKHPNFSVKLKRVSN